MDINWKAPFEFAFELGLFLLGSILILLIVFLATLIVYAIIKGFVLAIRRAKAAKDTEEVPPAKTKTINLKSVE